MNDTVLYLCMRIYRFNRSGKAGEIIRAGDENIFNALVIKPVQHLSPILSAFVLAYPHAQNVLPAVKIDAYGYVDRLLYDLPFASYMVVYRVEKYHSVDRLKRSLLPLFCDRQYLLVRYPAHRGIRNFQTVYVADMRLNVRRRHPLRVHRQYLFLDVLTDACLMLPPLEIGR